MAKKKASLNKNNARGVSLNTESVANTLDQWKKKIYKSTPKDLADMYFEVFPYFSNIGAFSDKYTAKALLLGMALIFENIDIYGDTLCSVSGNDNIVVTQYVGIGTRLLTNEKANDFINQYPSKFNDALNKIRVDLGESYLLVVADVVIDPSGKRMTCIVPFSKAKLKSK